MRRAAIFPFLGPALVLYLLADVSASTGELDALGLFIAGLAVLLSCALLLRVADTDEASSTRVGWLGFAAGIALLRMVPQEARELAISEVCALALCGVASVIFDLALHVPDTIVHARFARLARKLPYVLGAVAATLSFLAQGPTLVVFGSPVILPASYAYVPQVFAMMSVTASLVLRVSRRRYGSSPAALASNGWAVLGLVPSAFSLLLVLASPWVPAGAKHDAPRLLAAISAATLYLGHLWLIDPRRRLSAGASLRELATAAVSGAIFASVAIPLFAWLPRSAGAFALWVVATLFVGLVLVATLRPVVHRLLAPFRGRLLDELRVLSTATASVHSLEGLARIELSAMRRASGLSTTEPLLFTFDPAMELRIDAAGEPHRGERALHPAIAEQLRAAPGEIVVRAPLEALIVRQPKLRPLVLALEELDALCVLPLVSEGELEGALLVPAGVRRSPLSLEELDALRAHAGVLASLLSVYCSQARIEARSSHLIVAHERAEARVERLEDELARARADLQLLHSASSTSGENHELIAYSPPMRELLDKLRSLAGLDVPVLLQAEAGIPLAPFARFLHVEGGRAHAPFISVACATLRDEASAVALFGGKHGDVQHPGALRIAGPGTVLLTDVAALPRDAQRMLSVALASRTVRSVDGTQTFALQARVIVSSEVDVQRLVSEPEAEIGVGASDAHAGFDAELAQRLSPACVYVPPLRARREDIASHCLLAIDRACRRLGRATLGLEPEALDALRAHDFPGNVAELERVVDHAVLVCRSERVRAADLAFGAAPASHTVDPLDGTLEEIERRALEHALEKSLGNKSEAARLLGLPRTTFLDKLRKHKLDDGARDNPSSPPN